jgi:uncharacterized protein (DUF2461 family)
MTAVLDKTLIKQALRELIREEPATFKSFLKEILRESSEISEEEQFDALIQKNFQRFGETFRALA